MNFSDGNRERHASDEELDKQNFDLFRREVSKNKRLRLSTQIPLEDWPEVPNKQNLDLVRDDNKDVYCEDLDGPFSLLLGFPSLQLLEYQANQLGVPFVVPTEQEINQVVGIAQNIMLKEFTHKDKENSPLQSARAEAGVSSDEKQLYRNIDLKKYYECPYRSILDDYRQKSYYDDLSPRADLSNSFVDTSKNLCTPCQLKNENIVKPKIKTKKCVKKNISYHSLCHNTKHRFSGILNKTTIKPVNKSTKVQYNKSPIARNIKCTSSSILKPTNAPLNKSNKPKSGNKCYQPTYSLKCDPLASIKKCDKDLPKKVSSKKPGSICCQLVPLTKCCQPKPLNKCHKCYEKKGLGKLSESKEFERQFFQYNSSEFSCGSNERNRKISVENLTKMINEGLKMCEGETKIFEEDSDLKGIFGNFRTDIKEKFNIFKECKTKCNNISSDEHTDVKYGINNQSPRLFDNRFQHSLNRPKTKTAFNDASFDMGVDGVERKNSPCKRTNLNYENMLNAPNLPSSLTVEPYARSSSRNKSPENCRIDSETTIFDNTGYMKSNKLSKENLRSKSISPHYNDVYQKKPAKRCTSCRHLKPIIDSNFSSTSRGNFPTSCWQDNEITSYDDLNLVQARAVREDPRTKSLSPRREVFPQIIGNYENKVVTNRSLRSSIEEQNTVPMPKKKSLKNDRQENETTADIFKDMQRNYKYLSTLPRDPVLRQLDPMMQPREHDAHRDPSYSPRGYIPKSDQPSFDNAQSVYDSSQPYRESVRSSRDPNLTNREQRSLPRDHAPASRHAVQPLHDPDHSSRELGRFSRDLGHSFRDPGHSSPDSGHSLRDPGHFSCNPEHCLHDTGLSSRDQIPVSRDPGHSICDCNKATDSKTKFSSDFVDEFLSTFSFFHKDIFEKRKKS